MEATCVDHYAIVYPDYLLTAKGLILMILNAVLLRQTKSKTSTLPGIGGGIPENAVRYKVKHIAVGVQIVNSHPYGKPQNCIISLHYSCID